MSKNIITWLRWFCLIPAYYGGFHTSLFLWVSIENALGRDWDTPDIRSGDFIAITLASAVFCLICAIVAPKARKRVALSVGLVNIIFLLLFVAGDSNDPLFLAAILSGVGLACLMIHVALVLFQRLPLIRALIPQGTS